MRGSGGRCQPNRDTVLVGAASGRSSTGRDLGLLLAAAMPFVVASAAAATFVLVRRLVAVGHSRGGRRHQRHDLSGRVPSPRIAMNFRAGGDDERHAGPDRSGQAEQRRFVRDAPMSCVAHGPDHLGGGSGFGPPGTAAGAVGAGHGVA